MHLESPGPRAALTEFLENSAGSVAVETSDPENLYRAERDFLAQSTLAPLLYLPRSYAVGERVRDLRLAPDGNPILPNISLAISLADIPAQTSGASQ